MFNKMYSSLKRNNLGVAALLTLVYVFIFQGVAISQNTTIGLKKVVLDAGHGGHDPGNLGTGRYKSTEKDIALDVVLLIGKYINENYPEVEVIYTRDSDRFLKLRERTDIANKAGADLFISVHCNSAPAASAKGTESFIMGLHKTEANLELAKKENSSIYLEKDYKDHYGNFDPKSAESYIELTLRQQIYRDQSANVAMLVQQQFEERVQRRDRGVKEAPFYVICYTTMPSILVELGFLSNAEEEDFLNSENGKVYMASAIYRAFKAYKQEVESKTITEDNFQAEVGETTTIETPKASADVAFKIQIATSSRDLETLPQNFKGLKGVEKYKTDKGLYKYTFGNESTYERAKELLAEAKSKGYTSAYIVAFKEGKRISLNEALSQINQ